MKRVEGPNGEIVEFPDGTSDNVINVQMRRTFGGPSTLGRVGQIALEEAKATPGRVLEGAKRLVGAAIEDAPSGFAGTQREVIKGAARTLPGLAPNPLIAAPLSALGEGIAETMEIQRGERAGYSPGQIGVAGALPIAAATAIRGARALGRTATRNVPSLFERAQGQAQQAGQDLVENLRPSVNVGQLQQGVAAAGGDMIPMTQTSKIMRSTSLPPTPYPHQEAAATTVDNLTALMKPGGTMALADLETVRKGVGPIAGRSNAPHEVRALYQGMVQDLEAAAAAGSPGAAMARDAATAFKAEMGAARVAELIEKASPSRMISGADVKPLNVATLKRLADDPKTARWLEQHIGPDGVAGLQAFIQQFRGLPPTVAYSFANRALTSGLSGLGALAGGAVAGGPAGVGVGLMAGPAVEFVTNLQLVGRNPALLNQWATTMLQGVRAATSDPRTTTAPPER